MSRLISRSVGSSGGRILPPNEQGGDEGGGGGEKVFFDDGQVKVTESLVTIGHPWNKAFAVREITSVTYGKNRSNDLGASILRTAGWLALGFGLLMGLAGFWSGMVFGLFMGLGLLFGSRIKDAAYSVTLSTGGFWETEYLSSKSLGWCEAVASAVQQAIAYKPEPPSSDGGQFIPAPQSRLRN
jgi:F0F1-type ATP synthase membrane subunit c/vacuolar-type H+-ATPase subunit K